MYGWKSSRGTPCVYDDEVAVGAVFQDAKLDKPVKVTRPAPQSPETNGVLNVV